MSCEMLLVRLQEGGQFCFYTATFFLKIVRVFIKYARDTSYFYRKSNEQYTETFV